MASYTPGPWRLVGTEIWAGHRRITMGRGAFDEQDRKIRDANARLIAQAPAMVEALGELLHYAAQDPQQTLIPDGRLRDAGAILAAALGSEVPS